MLGDNIPNMTRSKVDGDDGLMARRCPLELIFV
jgi:hypothetical protein